MCERVSSANYRLWKCLSNREVTLVQNLHLRHQVEQHLVGETTASITYDRIFNFSIGCLIRLQVVFLFSKRTNLVMTEMWQHRLPGYLDFIWISKTQDSTTIDQTREEKTKATPATTATTATTTATTTFEEIKKFQDSKSPILVSESLKDTQSFGWEKQRKRHSHSTHTLRETRTDKLREAWRKRERRSE